MRIVCIGAGQMFQYCVRAILEDPETQVLAIFTWSESAAHRMSRFVLLDSFAKEHGIQLIKVESMNHTPSIEQLQRLKPDLVFVDGWSEKLSPAVLEAANDRFICIHPSLLPKARGGATLNWALIRGERDWGVSLFYLSQEIDQGDIIDQEPFAIEGRDDIETLFDKATLAAVDLLQRAIPKIRQGKAARKRQDQAQATFFPRRKPEEGEIDFCQSVREVHHLIRALTRPYPGAFFYWKGKRVYVWKASPMVGSHLRPSEILSIQPGGGVGIVCGNGILFVERIQSEGEPPMWADAWCQRHQVSVGTLLTSLAELK